MSPAIPANVAENAPGEGAKHGFQEAGFIHRQGPRKTIFPVWGIYLVDGAGFLDTKCGV